MAEVKEIEIKVKVDSFDKILPKMNAIGCNLTAPIKQQDTIYLPKGIKFGAIPPNTSVLRIRKQKDKTLLTLKQSDYKELVSVERELAISDARIMDDIIKLTGYYPAVKVIKSRRKSYLNDVEICLDEVKNLGNFIEVEKISSEPSDKIEKELLNFLKGLGVDLKNRVHWGYDTLVALNKK